jgi:FecR protein
MMPCSGPRGGLGMVAPRTHHALRSMAALIIGTLIVLALSHPSDAQQPTAQPVSAELTRVVGRVEILRKGQTQWAPAVVGARLVEGDDIRAFSGATAELLFPDSSTVVLAENSRLLLTKVEFDRQNQSRTVLLHLAVGKLRSAISQASVALVRARQSNFAISTPTAVAAARGTVLWVVVTDSGSLFAVEHERGGALVPSRVDCIPLGGTAPGTPLTYQAIFAGSQSMDCGAVTPMQPLTLSNPDTANSPVLAGAPVTVPARALEAATASFGPPTGAVPFSFNPNGGSTSFGPPSTFGQDIQQNQLQSQNQNNNNQGMSAGQNQQGNNNNP